MVEWVLEQNPGALLVFAMDRGEEEEGRLEVLVPQTPFFNVSN